MSAGFDADFFDGLTSRRRPAHVDVEGGVLAIRGVDLALDVPRADARVQPRIGSTPVRIDLPDGALLVAPDFDAVDASLTVPLARTFAHRLESHALFVVIALVGIAVGGFFLYTRAIPWGARVVAMHLSPGIESQLSEEALASFDRFFLFPTQATASDRARVEQGFERLKAVADVPADTHIVFRDGKIVGANALTLPGGVIVVTDQLVSLLDPEETDAVLAHELGHVHYRHGTRLVLSNSAHALVVMAVFGDASAVAGAAALAPTVFLNAGYSRDFEREADSFAFDLLRKTGATPFNFSSALRALEENYKTKHPNGARGVGYLSTHPDTAERIQAADDAGRETPKQ
jgi:Zn-dependent protease with chaperone function